MTLGECIKTVRKVHKEKQKDFAKRLFVSASYISKMEQDKEVPTDMFLKLLSYEYNVSFEHLIRVKRNAELWSLIRGR